MTSKASVRQFSRPVTASAFLQADKIQDILSKVKDPTTAPIITPRTRAGSATPSSSSISSISSAPASRSSQETGYSRKPSLPAELSRQEIFSRISTSSVNYNMRPNIPTRPAFARFGSLRHQEGSSGEESETTEAGKKVSEGENSDDNQLSVTFSDVTDDTDSINEISSIKEKIIEEEPEEEEREPVRQMMSSLSVRGGGRQVPQFQKTPSSETVKCTLDLKPVTMRSPPVVAQHHSKPLTPGGFVGFASLPDQVYRRSIRKGFEFSLMVVGESGLGKSTLVNSMFLTDIYASKENVICPSEKTVKVESHHVVLEEGGVKLSLNIVDTPGFGDGVDNTNCWDPIIKHVDEQFNVFLEAETRVNRVTIPDNRIHVCLYFIAPSGHGLKSIDVEFMRRLHDKVNIIPVIGKSDACTKEELTTFKQKILSQLDEYQINVYDFPNYEKEQQEEKLIPFAVVGSNVVVQDESGKRVRGRKYPWGTVNIEDKNHCDFLSLRSLVLAHHMQDLKDVTSQVHYEKYRCQKLTSMSKEGSLSKNPLALIEDEKLAHEDKLKRMDDDMEDVFKRKVEEKKEKMKRLERDEENRLERDKKGLQEEKLRINMKREELENEKKSWANTHGIEMSKFLARSSESLDGKRKKYTLPSNPFKFGRS